MKKAKIGIIGAGRIGKIHAEHLLRHPRAELVAVSDLFAGPELDAWAQELGAPKPTNDAADVLRDPGIDAVYICSSTDTHVPLIKQAAAAGKHIFCEKPISMDVGTTEEALEAVRTAGVKLQIGFNRRFDHNFRTMRERVASGAIGDPHVVKITSRDPSPPPISYVRVSGGLFMDMAIHDFDIARYLTGSEVTEVYAVGAVLVDPAIGEAGDVDTAVVTLKFANGAIGVIDNSRQAVYGYDQRAEVFGSKGSIAVANDMPSTAVLSTADGVVSDKPLHFFLERYAQAYADETNRFLESVLDGAPLLVTGDDGLQAERIALAAKLSCRLNRSVRLDELPTLRAAESAAK